MKNLCLFVLFLSGGFTTINGVGGPHSVDSKSRYDRYDYFQKKNARIANLTPEQRDAEDKAEKERCESIRQASEIAKKECAEQEKAKEEAAKRARLIRKQKIRQIFGGCCTVS